MPVIQSGDNWIYESGNGTITDGVYDVGSVQQDDGTWCYLFQNVTAYGKTTTLYGLIDGKVVKLAFRNIMGKATEYKNPYPLVIAEPGISYHFNDGDDYRTTTERASIEFDGKKFDDCILVTEKIYADDELMHTEKRYYAKNVGLVYVTTVNSQGKESVYKKMAESSLYKQN